MLYITKLSFFLDSDVPAFILGAFYNRFLISENNQFIYTVISYKSSKRLSELINSEFDNYLHNYINILNSFSNNYKWNISNSETKQLNLNIGNAYLILENDINISANSFYNKLYSKIINLDIIHTNELNDYKKEFIRGFFEPRGSIDTKLGFLTQDYFYNNDFEFRKINLLYDFFNIPTKNLNLNFRELQGQFVSKENQRNTQLRIKLKWYLHNIGMINPYKNLLISQEFQYKAKQTIYNVTYYLNDSIETKKDLISTFEERIKYYTDRIYHKKLTDADIEKVRQEIGFDEEQKQTLRDTSLITVFRDNTEDKCICCKEKYDIKDRSFINKKTNRYYFEIHHVISLGANKELDDENNLSKLCPTCHAALKRGRATENYQKSLIKNILKNSPNILDFSKHYFDTDDENIIIDLIYQNLK